MSGQELDVKRAWRAIRRHRRIVAGCALVGLAAGATVGALVQPLYTATSLIVLPPPAVAGPDSTTSTHSIETHVLIARSEPVFTSAGQNLDPPLDVETVRELVEVTAVTDDVLEIQAKGTSEEQAVTLTNAVAEIYLVFVTTEQNLPADIGNRSGARVLQQATSAHGGNPVVHYGLYGILGLAAGALLGSIGVLAVTRGDRRLHLRDELANAVGIPVLASVSSYRARNASDWAHLLERYKPSAVDAWSIRRLLQHLSADLSNGDDSSGRSRTVSLAVITVSDDEKALALGPQLAAFANSAGIATSLVVDAGVAAANALLGDPETDLSVVTGSIPAVNGNGSAASAPALRISMIVVDRSDPDLAEAHNSKRTIVGLSSGAVTAEEIARIAVLAAAQRREIDGIVVVDPDPHDQTTGRVPQTMRRGSSRLPTTITGTPKRTTP